MKLFIFSLVLLITKVSYSAVNLVDSSGHLKSGTYRVHYLSTPYTESAGNILDIKSKTFSLSLNSMSGKTSLGFGSKIEGSVVEVPTRSSLQVWTYLLKPFKASPEIQGVDIYLRVVRVNTIFNSQKAALILVANNKATSSEALKEVMVKPSHPCWDITQIYCLRNVDGF